MSAKTVADRYAKSLMESADEQNKVDAIYNDIKDVKETLENRDLLLMLRSPIIKSAKKISALKAVYEGKVDPLMMSFFGLAVNKGRESILPDMCDSFIDQYRIKNNIASAKVITATKLTEEKLTSIKASMNLGATKLEIEEEVDESLIGGFILVMGDKRYDASVKHKLNKLRQSFS